MYKIDGVFFLMLLIKCAKGKSEITTLSLNKTLCSVVCSSDYREVVNRKPLFVDKTHLIINFLAGPYAQLVTAPSHFGKSTVIDMLKRFFEIPINKNGSPTPVQKSENYKLFVKNKLEICKYTNLFGQYFGKHPVVHINFEPLSEFKNLKDMMVKIRTIFHWSFVQHVYLKYSLKLWRNDTNGKRKMVFIRHIKRAHFMTLKETEIKAAFHYLTQLLFYQFSRKVVLLVDGYDTFLHNLLFRDFKDLSYILEFMSALTEDLMKPDRYVMRAFITGVFDVIGPSLIPHVNNVAYLKFLGNNPLSIYLGLNRDEVQTLLNRAVNETEHKTFWDILDTCYNGFMIEEQNTKIYNMWSVLNFFENKLIDWYWCKVKHFSALDNLILSPPIAEALVRIMQGKGTMRMNVKASITREILMTVKELIKTENPEMQFQIDSVLVILYNMGYLMATIETINGIKVSKLNVPNQEILHEFSALLRESYRSRFHFSVEDVQELSKVIDFFQQDGFTYEIFQLFHEKLNIFIQNSTYRLHTKSEIQGIIFTYLIEYFPWSKTGVPLSMKNNSIVRDSLDAVIVNSYDVAVFLEIEVIQTLETDETKLEYTARWCHYTVLEKSKRLLEDNNIKKIQERVYVGVSIDKETKELCTVFSYSTLAIDKSEDIITIKSKETHQR